MNQILIWEPRWSTREVLIADRRLLDYNEIVITEKRADGTLYFPAPFYLTGKRAREFPLEQMQTKTGGTIAVRAIPLEELTKEVIA